MVYEWVYNFCLLILFSEKKNAMHIEQIRNVNASITPFHSAKKGEGTGT